MELFEEESGGFMRYMSEPINYIDLSSTFLTLIIVVMTITDYNAVGPEVIRMLAAPASLLIIFKLFDWLRLFDGTSFFV